MKSRTGFFWTIAKLTCAAGIALMVTVGLFFLIAGVMISGGNNVTVPNLVGSSIVEAHAVLHESGLTLEISPGSRYSPIVQKDSIISQDPLPGRTVKSSRKIRVVLSRGTETTGVPDVTGRDVRYAAVTLEEVGLWPETEVRIHYAARAGIVVGQDPPAGRSLARDTGVTLLVSRGAPRVTYVMPNLVGDTLDEVTDVLNRMNMNIRAEYEKPPSDTPIDVVFYQDPLPGMAVVEGDTVLARVSKPITRKEIQDWESLEGALIRYDVPPGLDKRRVRIQVQDAQGRSTEFDRYVEPGTTITVPVLYREWLEVEIKVDGRVVKLRHVGNTGDVTVQAEFREFLIRGTLIEKRPMRDVADDAIQDLLYGMVYPGDYIG